MQSHFPYLEADIERAPIVSGKARAYELYSIGESGHHIEPELINEVFNGLMPIVKHHVANGSRLCAVAPGGNPWAMLLALHLSVSLTIFRPHITPLTDKIKWSDTPFDGGDIYAPTLSSNDRIIVLDDVIGSGSVSDKILGWCLEMDIQLESFITVIDRNTGGSQRLEGAGIKTESLITLTPRVSP